VEEVVASHGVTALMQVVVWDQWFFGHGELQIQNYVGVKKQSTHPTAMEVIAIFQTLMSKYKTCL
jgi:hypothetical protein